MGAYTSKGRQGIEGRGWVEGRETTSKGDGREGREERKRKGRGREFPPNSRSVE